MSAMPEHGPAAFWRDREFYVPRFEVEVSGRPMDPGVVHDITEVTYKDDVEKIDEFNFTVNNWDADSRDFKYSDEDTFFPGTEVSISVGYQDEGELTRLVRGEIVSMEPAFPAAGQPVLQVNGLNLLHRLRQEKRSEVYEQQTDSDIAQTIAARLGVDIDTQGEDEDEETYEYLIQDNQFDIVFLMNRARAVGYDLFVEEEDESRLWFGPSERVQDAVCSLTYGRDLVEFKPTLATALQVGKVTVRGWDPVAKQRIEKTVTRAELVAEALGDDDAAQIDSQLEDREEVISDRPVRTEQEAQTLARRTLQRIANGLVTASGTVVGLPELRAGVLIEVGGVGERFGGSYFVTGTSHTLGDSGYTTQFDCRKQET